MMSNILTFTKVTIKKIKLKIKLKYNYFVLKYFFKNPAGLNVYLCELTHIHFSLSCNVIFVCTKYTAINNMGKNVKYAVL